MDIDIDIFLLSQRKAVTNLMLRTRACPNQIFQRKQEVSGGCKVAIRYLAYGGEGRRLGAFQGPSSPNCNCNCNARCCLWLEQRWVRLMRI